MSTATDCTQQLMMFHVTRLCNYSKFPITKLKVSDREPNIEVSSVPAIY